MTEHIIHERGGEKETTSVLLKCLRDELEGKTTVNKARHVAFCSRRIILYIHAHIHTLLSPRQRGFSGTLIKLLSKIQLTLIKFKKRLQRKY